MASLCASTWQTVCVVWLGTSGYGQRFLHSENERVVPRECWHHCWKASLWGTNPYSTPIHTVMRLCACANVSACLSEFVFACVHLCVHARVLRSSCARSLTFPNWWNTFFEFFSYRFTTMPIGHVRSIPHRPLVSLLPQALISHSHGELHKQFCALRHPHPLLHLHLNYILQLLLWLWLLLLWWWLWP